MPDRLDLTSSTQSARHARVWVSALCERWDCAGATDVLTLIVSELVEASVRHGSEGLAIEIERVDGTLVGALRTSDGAWAHDRHLEDEDRWMLQVVDALVDRWSVIGDADVQRLRFEVPCRLTPMG